MSFFFRQYLSLGDVHEHGEAGHVVALTADVAVVPVEHLTAFSRPASRTPDPKRTKQRVPRGGGEQ